MAILDEAAPQYLIAVLIICLGIWYVSKRRQSTGRLLPGTRVPPCFKSVPILGSLPFMSVDANDLHKYFMQQRKIYGDVFALYLGSKYAVVLNSAESIREGLLKKSAHFADRPVFFSSRFLNPDRKGVIIAPYDHNFRQKRQLYLSIMKQFGFGQRVMETRINVEISKLIEQARLTRGRPFDPNDMLHMSVVSVIASILFGQRNESDNPMLRILQNTIHKALLLSAPEIEMFPSLRFLPMFRRRWTAGLNMWHEFRGILTQEIDNVIKSCNNEQDDTNDSFIRQFIKSTLTGEEYDREELLMVAQDLFIAGDDTSSTTLRWALLHLANHPDVQSRLQKEVETVVGFDRLPSLDDEANMPYTQAFILETLRRHTLVPLSVFRQTVCDTRVKDFFVPMGTLVITNLYSAHMDPDKWDKPEVFKPERFLNDLGQISGRDQVMAFSLGKRSCLGESLARQELFLFTSGIVQNFDVRPPEGQTEITCEEETTFVTEPSAYQVRMIERTR